jgi:hypothetical protein
MMMFLPGTQTDIPEVPFFTPNGHHTLPPHIPRIPRILREPPTEKFMYKNYRKMSFL